MAYYSFRNIFLFFPDSILLYTINTMIRRQIKAHIIIVKMYQYFFDYLSEVVSRIAFVNAFHKALFLVIN